MEERGCTEDQRVRRLVASAAVLFYFIGELFVVQAAFLTPHGAPPFPLSLPLSRSPDTDYILGYACVCGCACVCVCVFFPFHPLPLLSAKSFVSALLGTLQQVGRGRGEGQEDVVADGVEGGGE
jgi:hypothetical protein